MNQNVNAFASHGLSGVTAKRKVLKGPAGMLLVSIFDSRESFEISHRHDSWAIDLRRPRKGSAFDLLHCHCIRIRFRSEKDK
jgi:hypothetical protein